MQNQIEAEMLSPYDNFLYALKRKKQNVSIHIDSTNFYSSWGFKEQLKRNNLLYDFAKNKLIEPSLIRFINSQKERIENTEITEGTL